MVQDLLELYSIRLSGDEVAAVNFAEVELQQRVYRQCKFEFIGKHRFSEILEKDLAGLREFLRNQWSRMDLMTDISTCTSKI